jgi:hypothetical protein
MNAAFFLLAETAQWRWLTWGSAFAAIAWAVVSNYSRGTPRILPATAKSTGHWACDRLHDMDVAFFHRHLAGHRAQCRDGAPHRVRHGAESPRG